MSPFWLNFRQLAALEVVILTTSSAAGDEKFVKIKLIPFQCVEVEMKIGLEANYRSVYGLESPLRPLGCL